MTKGKEFIVKAFFSINWIILLSECKTTTLPTGCYTKIPGRVPSCLDKYAVIQGHVNCLGNFHMAHKNNSDSRLIEDLHNDIRRNVNPPAADMVHISYNTGLERTAQIWALQCDRNPNTFYQRYNPGSFSVGQNVLVSSSNITWTEVINTWKLEESYFSYNKTGNDVRQVGNYTQMIWPSTSVVGCGSAQCGSQFFYVCNYAPSMNGKLIDTPYLESASGKSCDSCPAVCNNNLCDCQGLICLNGASLNWTQNPCTCNCINTVRNYSGAFCDLFCNSNGDDARCGKPPYTRADCATSEETLVRCPWMCDVCPYGSKDYKQRSSPLPYQRGRQECTTATSTTTPTVTTSAPLASASPSKSSTPSAAWPRSRSSSILSTASTATLTTGQNASNSAFPRVQRGGCSSLHSGNILVIFTHLRSVIAVYFMTLIIT